MIDGTISILISLISRSLMAISGPRQANLVLIADASSEGSGEPARTSAARSYKQ